MDWMQIWMEVLEILGEAIPYLSGAGAVFVITFLKNRVGDSRPVQSVANFFKITSGAVITILVSIIVAVIYVTVEFQLGIGQFDPANISDVFLAVVSAASTYYFKFHRKPEERDKAEEVF